MTDEKEIADFESVYALTSNLGSFDLSFKRGRVILSTRRLVIVGNDEKRAVPLRSILQVRLRQTPTEKDEEAVLVKYGDGDSKEAAVVKSNPDVVHRFYEVLNRLLLSGREVYVEDPVEIGGRRMATSWERTRLRIEDGTVLLEDTTRIDPDEVQSLRVKKTKVDSIDSTGKSLTVRYLRRVNAEDESRSVTTRIFHTNERFVRLLYYFAGRRYHDVVDDIKTVSVSERQERILSALYSGLTAEETRETVARTVKTEGTEEDDDDDKEDTRSFGELVSDLKDKDLVGRDDRGVRTTMKGNVYVNTVYDFGLG
ncbi:MAG: CheF family chemotaxis protein [Halobacteria archaeon]|nr:CheF family chemotaxis protein [Halobacteria archaeon]